MRPTIRNFRAPASWLPALVAACLLVAATLACGGGGSGGSSPTAPPPLPQPAQSAAASTGTYGTEPCCCGFWTYTLTRAGRSTSWTCWGWVEIESQAGTQLAGYTNMERAATDCPDDGGCAMLGLRSTGQLDASGALTWNHGAGDFYSRQVAEKHGCTVVSDDHKMTGALSDGALQLGMTATLACDRSEATLTLTARGVRLD